MAFFDLSPHGIIFSLAEILGAPYQNPGILWIGLPLIATLIIVELNLKEDKRWSPGGKDEIKQALPNAIILLFVSIEIMRMAFSSDGDIWGIASSGSFFAGIIVLLLAVAIFLIDYYHEFPTKKLLGFSAHLPANTLAYSMLVVAYSSTGFSLSMIVGIIIFAVILALIFLLVGRLDIDSQGPGESHRKKDSGAEFGNSKLVWIRKANSPDTKIGKGKGTAPGDIADPFRGAKKLRK